MSKPETHRGSGEKLLASGLAVLAGLALSGYRADTISKAQDRRIAPKGCAAVIENYRPAAATPDNFDVRTATARNGKIIVAYLLGADRITCHQSDETAGSKKITIDEEYCLGDQQVLDRRSAGSTRMLLRNGPGVAYSPDYAPISTACHGDQAITPSDHLPSASAEISAIHTGVRLQP